MWLLSQVAIYLDMDHGFYFKLQQASPYIKKAIPLFFKKVHNMRRIKKQVHKKKVMGLRPGLPQVEQ